MNSDLYAISPLDGRYQSKTIDLKEIFSEYGLMRHRLLIEIKKQKKELLSKVVYEE